MRDKAWACHGRGVSPSWRAITTASGPYVPTAAGCVADSNLGGRDSPDTGAEYPSSGATNVNRFGAFRAAFDTRAPCALLHRLWAGATCDKSTRAVPTNRAGDK